MNCDEDPSILKAKKTMNKVLKPLDDHNAKIRADLESKMRARRRTEKRVSQPAESDGRPTEASSEQGIDRNDREADLKAVRESLKDDGLEPIAKREEGEQMA